MSKAICFNCKKVLGIGRSMEQLILDKFPVFCSKLCADEFPNNGTKLFEDRLKALGESK